MDHLDVIIFGASGFTGKYTIFEGVKLLSNVKWGVAGRNKEKLAEVLKEIGKKTSSDLSQIPIIIADVSDESSLQKMAERAKIIVNCCGPYRFYGEPVIKACINAGTHHVDVSGEPQFMERMQLEYNELAREKGVYIISACGFDSIPADLGVVFLENHFDGEVNSVEMYLETGIEGTDPGGAVINFGTWESLIYGLTYSNELRNLRTKLFKNKLPELLPKLKKRNCHQSDMVNNRWSVIFPGADTSVVRRSQKFFYENDKKRPIQFQAYYAFESFFNMFATMLIGFILFVLTKFQFGRNLLLNYPKLFSFWCVSKDGPSEEKMRKTKFSITLKGHGWPSEDRLLESTDKHVDPPRKELVVRVTGSNPGYGATCVALLLSALTILKESKKIPLNGGVLTPAAVFSKTNLIAELCKHGFIFEVISSKTTDVDKMRKLSKSTDESTANEKHSSTSNQESTTTPNEQQPTPNKKAALSDDKQAKYETPETTPEKKSADEKLEFSDDEFTGENVE